MIRTVHSENGITNCGGTVGNTGGRIVREITIAGRRIADDTEAFVVAEIGCNHGGSVEVCRQMILAAAAAGVDAVKLQKRDLSYWSEHDPRWYQPYNSEHAFGATYGEHRAALEFDADQHDHLLQFAERQGLVYFATAFDLRSLDLLAQIGVPVIKLASASITNIPLLDACAITGLPVIASTGGATSREVINGVSHLLGRVPGSPTTVAVLHCVATYPTQACELNLNAIKTMRADFPNLVVGLSDHFSGIAFSPVAYVLGARIFEKHFTLHRADKGTDNAFSLEPEGMRKLVRDLRRTREALGDGVKRRLPEEVQALRNMGRRDL